MIDAKNIKSIDFGFENCESVLIPFECFEDFIVEGYDENGKSFNKLYCKIKDNGQTSYSCGWGSKTPPIHRINQYDDITSINIIYDNNIVTIRPHWYFENEYEDRQSNDYQQSELMSFNELELTIDINSKRFNLKEVLQMPSDTEIIGENGVTYKVCEENDNHYLSNTVVSSKLLDMKFKKINYRLENLNDK